MAAISEGSSLGLFHDPSGENPQLFIFARDIILSKKKYIQFFIEEPLPIWPRWLNFPRLCWVVKWLGFLRFLRFLVISGISCISGNSAQSIASPHKSQVALADRSKSWQTPAHPGKALTDLSKPECIKSESCMYECMYATREWHKCATNYLPAMLQRHLSLNIRMQSDVIYITI